MKSLLLMNSVILCLHSSTTEMPLVSQLQPCSIESEAMVIEEYVVSTTLSTPYARF